MQGQNQLTSAAINFSNTGANTVVAAVTGRRIRVWKMNFTCTTASNLTFEDGSTALSGAYDLQANGSIFFPYDSAPYYETTIGAGFVISQSGTSSIQGTVYYTTV